MKTYLLDTNAILRFYLEDNKEQAGSVRDIFMKAFRREVKVVLNTQVIFEVEFILDRVYKVDQEQRAHIIDGIISTPFFDFEEKNERSLLLQALPLSLTKGISLVDAFLVCKASDLNAELLSFDKKLQKIEVL